MGRTYHYPNTGPYFLSNPAQVDWDEGHKINWDVLDERFQEDAVTIKLNGAVSVNDVSITVDALTVAIPKGVALHFGESKEFVFTTDLSAVGDTTIAIEAAPTALEDNDEAYWSPSRPGKRVKAGTFMTLEGGYMIPRANATAIADTGNTTGDNVAPIVITSTAHGLVTGDIVRVSGAVTNTGANGVWRVTKIDADSYSLLGSQGNGAAEAVTSSVRAAVGLLGSDAFEKNRSAALSGHGLIIGAQIYSNLLPEALVSAFQTYLEELLLRPGGRGFQVSTYVDNAS